MAFPIETPSRIWRRIKESEAHDAEMPSLPSLSDLDDSGMSDLGASSFSLEHDTPSTKRVPSVSQSAKSQLSAAPPATSHLHVPDEGPTMPSCATSLHEYVHEEYDDGSTDPFMLSKRLGVREHGSPFNNTAPEVKLVNTGTLHGMHSVRDQGCIPISLAHASSSNGGSSTTAVPLPDSRLDPDRNLASIGKSQALQMLGNSSSLPNAIPAYDFRDVASCRPYTSNRQPYSITSLSSSSAGTSSLSNRSDLHSRAWISDDVGRDLLDREFDTTTVRPDIDTRQEGGLPQICHDEDTVQQNAEKISGSREPAFPSEDVEATHATGARFTQAAIFPSSLSTPAQTTPSHVIGAQPAQCFRNDQGGDEVDDLATPLPRRKSFLLSVVNSTTRPRLTVPTPHPRSRHQKTTGFADAITPGLSRVNARGKRRARLSNPTSQISTFVPSTPFGALPPGVANDDSPEGVTSTSFVSTASSHDLTLHHRVNASFDLLTGPQGVGRFNAGKLNMYLHGLNRRLQEENGILVNKIRSQQVELEVLNEQSRHRGLSGVIENEAAEEWVVEKENLEKKIAEVEVQLETRDKALAEEQAQRMRDKERWKERMTEVEDGVGQIVSDLEKRVEEAEMKANLMHDIERQLHALQAELERAKGENRLLKERTEQNEQIIANGIGDACTELSVDGASEKLGQDVQALRRQLAEKDNVLETLQESLAGKEKETSSLLSVIRDLESSLRVTRETIETSQQDAKELRKEQRELKDELRASQVLIDKLKSESTVALDQVKDLEKQLADAREKLADEEEALVIANERAMITSDELEKTRLNVQQLENALEESDRKILSDNNVLLELRSKLTAMEREREKNRSLGESQAEQSDDRIDVRTLEAELVDAMKEIERLTSLLNQNPARKALDKARESRINLLEKENQELLEQLRALREPSYFATPHRNVSMSGLSPMHRRLINLSLRAPRTPGEPLRNASWLMNATGEMTTVHLVEEIGRLQKELELANNSIDDKLDKLEEAGLGVVGLTKSLEVARRRIVELEGQLEEREARFARHSSYSRCGENDMDTGDPNATIQLRLTMVAAELESLGKQRDEEMQSSSGENAVLHDATSRLNIEIRRAKEELKAAKERGHKAETSKAELQQELSRAKKTIDDLEYFLQVEWSRLRTMSEENSNALKEKEKILGKLYVTEQKMEQTKGRLFRLKETNIKLEAELRTERKTANVEEAFIGNRESIERLRQERARLSDKYYDLQQQLAEASKNASDLAIKYAKLQISYDDRRRQLDRQAEEIESLRAAMLSQAQCRDTVRSNSNAQLDDEDLKAFASKLESELRRIQQDATRFGRDLVHLKVEREQLVVRHREEVEQHEHETKQIRAQLQDLKQQLVYRKEGRDFAAEIHATAESLKLRHNRECKGLFVQIRYLKAKFTRETALRDNLGYQKGYLLVLLSRYEKSEKKILAAIAQIGPLTALTQRVRFRSLRTAALAVIFISRARRASEAWREQRSVCSAVTMALDNIRKNRTLKA